MYDLRKHGKRATVSALIVLATITSGISAAAALPSSAQDAHPRGAEGTVAAKPISIKPGTLRHQTGPSTASGALSTVTTQTLNGGYTAAGVAMRNLGYGTISITEVPPGAKVKSAFLLWDIVGDQAEPAFARGKVDGKAVQGTEWASGTSPCWPVNDNFSYEADVTKLVSGNGSYSLQGFATGESDGADPWTSGSTPPLLEGASLVVIYQLASMPRAFIQIGEGATMTIGGSPASATLGGFTVRTHTSAVTSYIVADGQEAGNTASFDGSVLSGVGFPGHDPQAVPNYSQGNLWDTVTTDVSSLTKPGDTSASLSVEGSNDCLVWVGQVLAVSSKSGPVLGLGDSVTAGYGLGYAEGYPDNTSAYPAILAKDLGVKVRNYAVEGACASASGCTGGRLQDQIARVPDSFTPSIVTLSVGAGDIHFSKCLRSILEDSDLAMQAPGDPCKPATLATHLAALRTSLAADLQKLSAKYPDASILVMDYYDPFPAPVSASASPCPLNQLLTFPYEHAKGESWWQIAYNYFRDRNAFTSDARTVQAGVYNDTQTVLNQLNDTINAVVAGITNASVVSTADFAGHGICASGTELAFSPTGSVKLSVRVGSLRRDIHIYAGGDEVCPDPVRSKEWNVRFTREFSIDKPVHISGSIQLAAGANCLPHPTLEGQTALANDFSNQGQ
jgi:lysophospholipase L1-like esterase